MPDERILVVDDEPEVVRLCTRILTQAGYPVWGVTSGREAIVYLENEPVDLLIVDIKMPEIDGLAVLRRAREIDPDLTAVVITGYATLSTAIETLHAGARGFVLKPFGMQELSRAVEEALSQRHKEQERLRLRTQLPILEIAQALATEGDSRYLAGRLLETVARELRADQAVLLTLDEQTGQLGVTGAIGLPAQAAQMSIAQDRDSVAEILQGETPLLTSRITHLEAPWRALLGHADDGTAVLVSLRTVKQAVGVLGLSRLAGSPPFTPSELNLLSIIGGQIATALENARLYAVLQEELAERRRAEEALRQIREELERRVQERTAELAAINALLQQEVVERRQTEEALHRERDFISAVLDTAGALVVVLDQEGGIVRFNRACEQTTGYSFDEVRGKRMWDLFVAPGEAELVREAFAQLQAGQASSSHESHWLARDNRRRLIRWANTSLVDHQGSLEYFISIGIDIEEERRRQQEASVLAEMAKLISGTLDLEQVLNLTVTYATSIFQVDCCLLGLYREDWSGQRLIVGEGCPPEMLATIRDPQFSFGARTLKGVLEAQGPLAVEDLATHPDVDPRDSELLGLQSALVVPVEARGRRLGHMLLGTRCGLGRSFTTGEKELALAMANQAAMAIDNAQYYAAEQRRAEQFRVIGEVGRRITSILAVDELLQEIASLVKGALGYYLVGIALLEGEELVFRAGAGAVWNDPHFQPPRLKVGQQGITAWVAQSGEPLLVPDVTQDARYYALPQASGIRSELAVPLKTKEGVLGVLHVQSDLANSFDESDLEVLQALARQAAVAIENAQLYERAQRAATLEERQRLARELHDSVTQSLYSLTLLAETGRRSASSGDLERVESYLTRLGEISRQALKEMRLLVYELRPPLLAREGLVGILQQRLDAVEGRAGVEARLLVEGSPTLTPLLEEGLYRIAMEALNNALKHAMATTVTVRICAADYQVSLKVTDNGCGFDPEAVADTGGMGLAIMSERAERLGGTLTIDSRPGVGTEITVSLGIHKDG